MSRIPLLLFTLIAALVLAGCSKEQPEFTANDQVPAEQRTQEALAEGGGNGGSPGGTVAGAWVVRGTALKFDEAPATLPAGQVRIELQNMSGLPHDVVFEGVRGDKPVVETKGKDSDTGTVALQPGSYTYYCNVPGHRAAGMEGTVTVQ
jgi:plastocyanin